MSWAKWVGGGLGALILGPAGAAIGAGLGALLDAEMDEEATPSTPTTTGSDLPYNFTNLTFNHYKLSDFGPCVEFNIEIEARKYTFDGFALFIRPKSGGEYIKSACDYFSDADGDIYAAINLSGASPYDIFIPYSAFQRISYTSQINLECVVVKEGKVYARSEYILPWSDNPHTASKDIISVSAIMMSYVGNLVISDLSEYHQKCHERLSNMLDLNEEGQRFLAEKLARSVGVRRGTVIDILKNAAFDVGNLFEAWLSEYRRRPFSPSQIALVKRELITIQRALGIQGTDRELLQDLTTEISTSPEFRLGSYGTELQGLLVSFGHFSDEMCFLTEVIDMNNENIKIIGWDDEDFVQDGELLSLTDVVHSIDDINARISEFSFPSVCLPDHFNVITGILDAQSELVCGHQVEVNKRDLDPQWELKALCATAILIFADSAGLTSERVKHIKGVFQEFFELNAHGLRELQGALKTERQSARSIESVLESLSYDDRDKEIFTRFACILCLEDRINYTPHGYEVIKTIVRSLGVSFAIIDEVRTSLSQKHTEANKVITDAYSTLELPIGSAFAEVKKAYRRLSKDYHPDTQTGLPPHILRLMQEKFKEISEAYEALREHLDG